DEDLQPLLTDFIAIDYIDRNRILYNCPIPMLTSVYDTERIGKITFPEVELREDHAMWIDLLQKVRYARAIKETLAIYRIRNNSVSRNKLKIALKQYEVYRKYLKMNFLKSSYYTFFWALNGMKKYGKL
ncbi:MAG: glycosyltransferase family 2 protein, partial [Algoriella sp.]